VKGALAKHAGKQRSLGFVDITVQQPLNARTTETYPERVFFSSTYAADKSSPVILYVSGEWETSEDEIDYFVNDLAQQMKAYVVGVEHRFYGLSQPARPSGLTLDDLQDLTTEQAIEDVARVVTQINGTFGLTGHWITYGGSYAATLAAYLRLSHPELIYGAVAFSAPLQVTTDGLEGYESTAYAAFGPVLTAQVKQAVAYILAQVGTGIGDAWIQNRFNFPNLDFDRMDVAAILVNVIPQFAQSGRIPDLAKAMAGLSDDRDVAAALIGAMAGLLGKQFWLESPYGVKNDPTYMTDDSRWLFQAYSQYAWLYVTAPDPDQSFLPMPVMMSDLVGKFAGTFGQKYSVLQSDLSARMLTKLQLGGSRIVFVNSSFDPWSSVSLPFISDPAREISSVLVEGGRHCLGMGPLAGDPSASEYSAQQFYVNQISSWAR
jgi:serine protease 16